MREGSFNSTHSANPAGEAALSPLHSWSPENDIYGQRLSRADKECRQDPDAGRGEEARTVGPDPDPGHL